MPKPQPKKAPKTAKKHPADLKMFNRVKAGFVLRGESLSAYCAAHGIDKNNARRAFSGQWNGKKAKDLRTRLIKASNAHAITTN